MKENDPFFEKGLPQEVELEKSFLGAILLDQRIIDQASVLLEPDDLFLRSHQKIYRVLLHLAAIGQPLNDIGVISSELRRRVEFEEVGGATYIASLIDGLPRTDNLKPYADRIKEAALKRDLIALCQSTIANVFDGDKQFAEIAQQVETEVFALAETRRRSEGPRPVWAIAGPLVDFYEQKGVDPGKLIGLDVGYEDLNTQTLGLTPGITLVAARPSMGKTALAVNISCNVTIRSAGSVFFASLESGAEKIVQRILASEARVDSRRMRTGYMNKEEWARLHDALQSLAVTRFVIDDTPDLLPAELASRVRQYQAKNGLDLVVVDYLQLMARRLQMVRRYRDLRNAVQEVGNELVGLSRSLNVPVLGIAQLSRAVDDRSDHRPQMSDLAESASLEQDADLVLFLLREEQYGRTQDNRGLATIIFGKQRDGGTDEDITMAYIKEFTRFESLKRESWPKPPIPLAERRAAARHRQDFIHRNDPDDD